MLNLKSDISIYNLTITIINFHWKENLKEHRCNFQKISDNF